MTPETFAHRLSVLTPRQEAGIRALADDFREDLSKVHEIVLRFSERGGQHAINAHTIIGHLKESVVETLARRIKQTSTPDVRFLTAMAEGVADAESEIVTRLKSGMLDQRTVPPLQGMAFMEESHPPFRVCDEAYLLLRQVVHVESYLQYLVESRHFLSMTPDSKNREIVSCLRSDSFTRFFASVDDTEEE